MSVFNEFLTNYKVSDFTTLKQVLAKYEPGAFLKEESDQPNLFMIKHQRGFREGDLTPFLRATRGLVARKSDLKVMAPGVPMAIEDTYESRAQLQKSLEDATSTGDGIVPAQEIHDGVTYRLYLVDSAEGESDDSYTGWTMSTNGMIYPSRGWRGARSFADIFTTEMAHFSLDESCPLHAGKCYYINLCTPHHRNIIGYDKTHCYLTRVEDVRTGETFTPAELHNEVRRINSLISPDGPPLETCDVSVGADVLDQEKMINTDDLFGGYSINLDGVLYRIESASFKLAGKLRGNVPDIKQRWVALFRNQSDLEKYLAYFPEDKGEFDLMSSSFKTKVDVLFRQYCQRFKAGHRVTHDSRDVKAISMIHDLYLNRRAQGMDNDKARIVESDVVDVLTKMPDAQLFYTLNPNNVRSTKAPNLPEILSTRGGHTGRARGGGKQRSYRTPAPSTPAAKPTTPTSGEDTVSYRPPLHPNTFSKLPL